MARAISISLGTFENIERMDSEKRMRRSAFGGRSSSAGMKVEYEKWSLIVSLPKAEKAKPKQIQKVNESECGRIPAKPDKNDV